jgi:hypothetical protein
MAEIDRTLLAFIRIAAMDALTNLQAQLDHTREHDLDFDVLRWVADIDPSSGELSEEAIEFFRELWRLVEATNRGAWTA